MLGLGVALIGAHAEAREWTVNVGARLSARPPYEGANDVRLQPAPTLSIYPTKRTRRFTPSDPGFNLEVFDSRYFAFGAVVNLRNYRKPEGDLVGLREVKRAVEPGAFVEFWPTNWLRTRVEGRRGVAGHKGWVADAGLDVIYTGTKWDFSIGPRVGWGDEKYLDTYFGVTPEEAARSPFIERSYTPTEGRRYTGLQTAFAYHLDDHWRTTVNFGYRRLADRASMSPIVRTAGSGDYFHGGVGVIYKFGVSY
jgi:outer membrane protein